MLAPAPDPQPPAERLISRTEEVYGERFQDHLLEQYKLFVESSQKVSEKRITTGNYLLTVNSSLLTVYGIVYATSTAGMWLAILPVAGILVSLTWLSLVISYKDLNTAKFKVIHELEDHLPAALFRYEWHSCEQGRSKKGYKPITHLERWIPVIFAVVYGLLFIYTLVAPPMKKDETTKAVPITGTVDVNVKAPMQIELKQNQPPPTPPIQKRQPAR